LPDKGEGCLPASAFNKHPSGRRKSMGASLQKCACVNCWYCNEHENIRMWCEYATTGTGVAIRSTIGNVIEALKGDTGHQYIGKVRYLDYSDDQRSCDLDWDGLDLSAALTVKNDSFRHEQEVRVIMITPDDDIAQGIRAKVDLSLLIA